VPFGTFLKKKEKIIFIVFKSLEVVGGVAFKHPPFGKQLPKVFQNPLARARDRLLRSR